MTEVKNSFEQEINNAQTNPSANIGDLSSKKNSMEEVRTVGTPVTTELIPDEQGSNVQIQTADGLVVQQTSNEVANNSSGMSFVATLLTLAGNKLPKIIKYAVMYSAAKKAGFKMVFLKGNREVYNSQLNTLWKSARDKKMFAEGCYVVPLRPILEKFPDIKAYDIDGNRVTLDSSDVDMCLVVYDGQHRIVVCELHPGEVDVMLELHEFDGSNPLETIKQMNSFSKNWSGTDLRASNIGAGISTNRLYEESENLQKLHGITPKLAEYILTFKREATMKKDLVSGKDTTAYVAEHGNRGLGIINAAMTNFKSAKEVKKIEFMDAVVYTYDNVKDAEKGSFARNMKLYLGTMSETEREKVKKLITDKDFGKLKEYIQKGYNAFCAAGHTEEALTQMEDETDKTIDSYIDNLKKSNQEKAAKKPLKSGRVHEVIQHSLEIESASEKERLAKAEEDAEKAAKKAKKAQAVVEDLRKKAASECELNEKMG